MTFTESNIPTLAGKRIVVTGATSGLGFETARLLAEHNAQVIFAVRNREKGQSAADQIRRAHPHAQIEVMRLDLSDLASVRGFAEAFPYDQLDVLINNAGVMAPPFSKTADGFEMHFGTNHLGHFALTGHLMPILLAAPNARIVTIASEGHRTWNLNFDNLNSEKQYDKWKAYSGSKLANLLFAYELQRKFAAADASAISVAAHPGFTITPLQETGLRMSGDWLSEWMLKLGGRIIGQSVTQGALSSIYAAVSPEVRGGEYIGPTGFMNMSGTVNVGKSSPASYDQDAARRLWQISEELTGVAYQVEAVLA